jgi:hypothetical protein
MMYTEAEARPKVCPHLPVDYGMATVTDNETEQRVVNHAGCIASDCMAWRWGDPIVVPNPDGAKSIEKPYVKKEPAEGYCGLAGKP